MPVSVLKNPMLYELSSYAIQNIVAQKHMLLDKLHCRTYYYFIQIQSERFAKSISNLIDSKSLCCSIHIAHIGHYIKSLCHFQVSVSFLPTHIQEGNITPSLLGWYRQRANQ